MTRTQKHLHRRAGTSFTKAVRYGCAAMCPVVVISNWNKQQQQTGAGFQA